MALERGMGREKTPAIKSSRESCTAVSYTHLDVYKRQVYYRVQTGMFRNRDNAERMLYRLQADGFPAVSYTHLDVYKRQTLFFPLELLHVHTAIITKCNTFCFQQLPLVPPARGRASGMIHHPMTRVVSIIFCVGKNPSYQSCILLPPDEPGDLAVRGHLPFRNFFYHRQHFLSLIHI